MGECEREKSVGRIPMGEIGQFQETIAMGEFPKQGTLLMGRSKKIQLDHFSVKLGKLYWETSRWTISMGKYQKDNSTGKRQIGDFRIPMGKVQRENIKGKVPMRKLQKEMS